MKKLVKATGKAVKIAKRTILTVIKKVKIKVDWPDTDTERLKKAKGIKVKLTGNALFPVPYPPHVTSLTDFGNNIQKFDDAIVAVETKQPDAEANLRAIEAIVHNDVNSIAGMVALAMEADPANAQKIAESVNFATSYEGSRGPRIAEVLQATDPGCLIVLAEGDGTHEFEQSSDGGKTVEKTYCSTSGRLDVFGLDSDKKYWFRARQVLTYGRTGDWGPWVWNRPL